MKPLNICQVRTHNGQLSVYVCICVCDEGERRGACLEGRGAVLFLSGQSLHQFVSDGGVYNTPLNRALK